MIETLHILLLSWSNIKKGSIHNHCHRQTIALALHYPETSHSYITLTCQESAKVFCFWIEADLNCIIFQFSPLSFMGISSSLLTIILKKQVFFTDFTSMHGILFQWRLLYCVIYTNWEIMEMKKTIKVSWKTLIKIGIHHVRTTGRVGLKVGDVRNNLGLSWEVSIGLCAVFRRYLFQNDFISWPCERLLLRMTLPFFIPWAYLYPQCSIQAVRCSCILTKCTIKSFAFPAKISLPLSTAIDSCNYSVQLRLGLVMTLLNAA